MIVLKITNASDVVASRVGRFLERLTPDSYDRNKVETIVLQKLVDNLIEEGIKGEVATVQGLDIHGDELVIHDKLRVRHRQDF
jgi:hypothetical protein